MEDFQEKQYHKEKLFYGSIKPLRFNMFEHDGVNPFGINSEADGVCFTTSPQEAFEVYATPPYDENELPEGLSLMDAYKSEWFSKTHAIAETIGARNENGLVEFDQIKDIRDQVVSQAAPTIYPCTAEIYNPFIVSDKQPVFSESFCAESDFYDSGFVKTLLGRQYSDSTPIDIDRYQHSLAITMFNGLKDQEKSIMMTDCMEKSKEILHQFTRINIKKNENMNTFEFYSFVGEKLSSMNIKGKHSQVFSSGHDSIIIDEAAKMFGNAQYGNNKHVLVFDMHRIKFTLSKTGNNELSNDLEVANVDHTCEELKINKPKIKKLKV